MLLPIVKKCAEPDTTRFPYARGAWPPLGNLNVQYVLLCKRLRTRELKTQAFTQCSKLRVTCLQVRMTLLSDQLRRQCLRSAALPFYVICAMVAEIPYASISTASSPQPVQVRFSTASSSQNWQVMLFTASSPQPGRVMFSTASSPQPTKSMTSTFFGATIPRPFLNHFAVGSAHGGNFEVDVAGPRWECSLPGAYSECALDKRLQARRGGLLRAQNHRVRSSNQYAVLLRAPLQGRIVQVISEVRTVSPAIVAAALDTDQQLNAPTLSRAEHCWHACELHHYCRFAHPAEAACERWGVSDAPDFRRRAEPGA